MKVIISGRHVDLTPGLREFIERKAARIEDFFAGVRQVKVILEVQKYRHSCEIVFKAAGQTITSNKTTKDMYASVEEAVHAVERQATKRKEKLYSQVSRRHRGQKQSIRDEVETVEIPAPKTAVKKAAQAPRVSRLNAVAAKPMSVEEAALQLQASPKKEMLAFINAETRSLNVLIRRKRDFGLIESTS